MSPRPLLASVLLVAPLAGRAAELLPEPAVVPSAAAAARFELSAGERAVALAVSPDGADVAFAASSADGRAVSLWRPGAERRVIWKCPPGLVPREVAWHPVERRLFVVGTRGRKDVVVALTEQNGTWNARDVVERPEIRRLVVAPRPFRVDDEKGRRLRYRLLFATKVGKAPEVRSITEQGEDELLVAGAAPNKPPDWDAEQPPLPPHVVAPFAVPVAFHPAGHGLIWQDAKECFHSAGYDRQEGWKELANEAWASGCGGSLAPLPNGTGALRWNAGANGVAVRLSLEPKERVLAANLRFTAQPVPMPDGRGMAGLVDDGRAVVFVPVDLPLADVVNAWLFADTAQVRELLTRHGGLFRKTSHPHLHSLYDTELYHPCGGYDEGVPTRPHLVTTDIVWEIWGAAFQGVFIVTERHAAIPAFRDFVGGAKAWFGKYRKASRWTQAFAVAEAVLGAPAKAKGEVGRVLAAAEVAPSAVLGATLDYRDLKPRGHYEAAPDMAAYFRAFRYLVAAAGLETMKAEELRDLPADVRAKARAWARAYEDFTATPRAPQLFAEATRTPAWMRHPLAKPSLFPLSWGFDNEAIDRSIFHSDWPEAEQIKSPDGLPRLFPSGLDVAAAAGSARAFALLEDEFQRFPPLRTAAQGLARDFKTRAAQGALYEKWISALAVQWADAASPAGKGDTELWSVKRLQTGLASWATLRHTTVLVNDRSDAQCGEAGFEELVLGYPRGYVEPDPATFEAVARLLEETAAVVRRWPSASQFERDLREGVAGALAESAKNARDFKRLAEKQQRGEPFSAQENERIVYVARVAEHDFLKFRSLAQMHLGLSTPEPMPKVADVSTAGSTFFNVAVGAPLEWNHIVPYFGRRQLVKGAVYSYFEFPSDKPVTDTDWREQMRAQPHPAWVAPFIADEAKPTCRPSP